MKRDPYTNLAELSHQVHEKWYVEEWETGRGRVDGLAHTIRDLAVIMLIVGFPSVILSR